MAPTVSRKSKNCPSIPPPASHATLANLGTAPVTATRPIKTEGSVALANLFDDLSDDAPSDIAPEVKKKLPTITNPGAWNVKGAEVNGGMSLKRCTSRLSCALSHRSVDSHSKDSSARSTPAVNKVAMSLAQAFPYGKPMVDKPQILKCNHCKRAVSKHIMPRHIEGCLNKKQEKQRKKKEAKDARDAAARKERAGDSDEEDEEGAKKTASKSGGLTASKKRKAADEGDESVPKKKKKKDEPKTKAPRPKAPVDVEKQCGVELPQGGQCARSLTCKSHSMGAKRAVPGRSAPYDKLLLDYQRKNQAKLQKAAFDANAPNPDDDNLPSGPVDSEEEKDAVMQAISRSWGSKPIYQAVHVPLREKYQYNRMKGMLQSAFGSTRGGGFGSGGGGGGAFFSSAHTPAADSEGMVHARKGSVIPGARSMLAPSAHTKKPSVASGA